MENRQKFFRLIKVQSMTDLYVEEPIETMSMVKRKQFGSICQHNKECISSCCIDHECANGLACWGGLKNPSDNCEAHYECKSRCCKSHVCEKPMKCVARCKTNDDCQALNGHDRGCCRGGLCRQYKGNCDSGSKLIGETCDRDSECQVSLCLNH